jgi:ATP dependent DNA ligase C terminal region
MEGASLSRGGAPTHVRPDLLRLFVEEGLGLVKTEDRPAASKLNRAEFVVVGWSDPEGSRPYVGALLLGYFEPDGRLVYAVRVGTRMSQKTLATLHKRVQPRAERCLSPLPRLATTGSGGRWSWPRFIGSGPNWSPKSLI